MTTTEQPAYGTERISLVSPKAGGGPFVLERLIFIDEGQTHFYDEDSRDFVTWTGSWRRVETLGKFTSRESARLFMVERVEQSLERRYDLLDRHQDVIREAVARLRPMVRNAIASGSGAEVLEAIQHIQRMRPEVPDAA